jgi:hypothetical protein
MRFLDFRFSFLKNLAFSSVITFFTTFVFSIFVIIYNFVYWDYDNTKYLTYIFLIVSFLIFTLISFFSINVISKLYILIEARFFRKFKVLLIILSHRFYIFHLASFIFYRRKNYEINESRFVFFTACTLEFGIFNILPFYLFYCNNCFLPIAYFILLLNSIIFSYAVLLNNVLSLFNNLMDVFTAPYNIKEHLNTMKDDQGNPFNLKIEEGEYFLMSVFRIMYLLFKSESDCCKAIKFKMRYYHENLSPIITLT